MCNRNICFLLASFTAAYLASVKPALANPSLTLTSPVFANNAHIPVKFSCNGDNVSPALDWSGAPPSTRSFVLIVKDPDAPLGTFHHWIIFDIPASVASLPEGVPPNPNTAFGATQGLNDSGTIGYTGPCPPHGKDHHYHFHLYALDRRLGLSSNADDSQVEAAMQGHILGQTDLVGIFER